MSKHTHHQSRTEQIDNKEHGEAPFHYDPYQEGKLNGDIQTKMAVDDSAIQLRAYKLFQEKGGSDLDNWLEAEKMLMCNRH